MKTLLVIKHPAKSLREPSKEVDPAIIETPEFQEFCDIMVATMYEKDGVGLAAPQVGENVCVIVVNGEEAPEVYINPKISNASEEMQSGEEGCLSVPNVWGIVNRHKTITVTAFTRDNQKVERNVTGIESIIFQHEIDHINGILFIDKATEITRGKEHLGQAL
ncbi:MAG: peptide deformylase [bacterium]|nr:peptide deformylase [bacterium]